MQEDLSILSNSKKKDSLVAEKISKSFNKREVVKEVSLTIYSGEIVGLLGPNGAGKTTSFYLLVGLLFPDSGHVFLNKKDVTKQPLHKRAKQGIGYLPQNDNYDFAKI